MEPVNAFLPRALVAVLRNAPLCEEKVTFAWRTAVGPAVGRVTTVALDRGTLRVQTRDAAWRREVERSAAVVRARLDDLLGAGIVRRIDVV